MTDEEKTGTILDYKGDGPNDPKAPAFHPGWRAAKHGVGVSYKAPWEDPFSGFPEHGRRCARALADTGMAVHLRSVDPSMQFQQRFEVGGSDSEKLTEQYGDLLHCSIKSYLVEVAHVVADDAMLQRLVTHPFLSPSELRDVNRFKIISTVFERDRVSEHAVKCLNAVAQVWVANDKDRVMLERCGVERVRVVPIPHFPDDPLLRLRGRKRQPGAMRCYHIGKWEHRKAHHEMIGAFLLAFEPGEAKLYFKTSTSAPDFGDYPNSPEASVRWWLDNDRVSSKWDLCSVNENIFFIKRRIPPEQIRELHRVGDVYLSLSRGEGFDMPAYDAKLAGNLLVYTPSGGPQMYACPDDVPVPAINSVPCHPFYRWGDAEYLDWTIDSSVLALHQAKREIESGWSTLGHDLSHLEASEVGKLMRECIDEVVGAAKSEKT